jgi:hypothetical protein
MSDETNEQANAPAEGEVQTNDEAQAEQAKGQEAEQDETAKQESDGDDEQGGEDQDRPKRLSGAQRLKRRNEFLLNELAQRDRELEEFRRRSSSTAEAEQEKPPKEEDYPNDWLAYQDARNAYNMRKLFREESQRRELAEQHSKRGELQREKQIAHLERVEEARGTITDFDEVMAEMRGVNVRDDVIDEIMSSDKSALIAYNLAKNPEKLRELNAMSGRELAREVGRLEGSVRMPAAKKQTNTPPPLSKVTGGAAQSFDPKAASMDDYIAKRQSGWEG